MLTLRYMLNASSVLHLHPMVFVHSLYSPFLIPRIVVTLNLLGKTQSTPYFRLFHGLSQEFCIYMYM